MKYCKLIIFFLIINLIQCNKYLLPKIVVPYDYKLKIITTLNENGPTDFTFEGLVEIDIMCIADQTTKFTLHSKNLEINQYYKDLKHIATGRSLRIKRIKLDPKYDFLHFYVEPMNASEWYTIGILYKGRLSTTVTGYYLSSYMQDGVKTWLALTTFEPTLARTTFPCFDEPKYKAKFRIRLGHHKNLTALSNMPKIFTEPMIDIDEDYILDTFQETVPMSTYLVAFIVSEFQFETSEINETEIKIWAKPSALKQVEYAKQIAPRALTFLEEYFGTRFPLPKLDMVAVPNFSEGALESWGLITYKESLFLYDPQVSSERDRHKIATLICHEVSHNWCGNLVTMKWWNDLWLNEGIATYMGIVCANHLIPNKTFHSTSFLKVINSIFLEDSVHNSIPVSKPVDSPKEIKKLFGTIAYQKGAVLIRMMEKSLGKKVLRVGLQQYLNKHIYSNVEQDDLWEAMTNASHEANAIPNNWTIKEIMDTWTLQAGYPLVTVERNYETGVTNLTQQRYVRVPTNKTDENEPCWWIPLTYFTLEVHHFSDTKPKLWLTCPHKEETIMLDKPDQWVIFNHGITGLYKVNYDITNWQLIIDHLITKDLDDIPEASRQRLVRDIMEFAEFGILKYKLAFDMAEYLEREEAYSPWKEAVKQLSRVALLVQSSSSAHILEDYMKKLLAKLYAKYGGLDLRKASALRKLAFESACEYNVKQCIDDVTQIFRTFMKEDQEHNSIHRNIRPVIYCIGVKIGGQKEWDFVWEKYQKSNVSEQSELLKALACTTKRNILTKYISMILDENSGIRKEDALVIFRNIAKSELGFGIAKSFLYKNGAAILQSLMPKRKVTGYLLTVAKKITQKVDFKQFKDFLNKHPEFSEHTSVGIQKSFEVINQNMKWNNKRFTDLISALTQRSASSPIK